MSSIDEFTDEKNTMDIETYVEGQELYESSGDSENVKRMKKIRMLIMKRYGLYQKIESKVLNDDIIKIIFDFAADDHFFELKDKLNDIFKIPNIKLIYYDFSCMNSSWNEYRIKKAKGYYFCDKGDVEEYVRTMVLYDCLIVLYADDHCEMHKIL